jgi:hypothetical protein
MRRKLVQTFHLLARRRHSTGVGNLEHASEIAGAFQVDGVRPREQSTFDRLPSAQALNVYSHLERVIL